MFSSLARFPTRFLLVGTCISAITTGSLLATPAQALQENSGKETTTALGMEVSGFDAEIAEAHGYRIIVNQQGHEESVPVTTEAKREDALASARSSSTGNCGTAYLTTRPVASRGGINISTSYRLSGGRKSYGHLWKVSGQSRLGMPFTESFSGANNFDSTWNATHFRGLYGFSHGQNSINLTSHAKLTNGSICSVKALINTW